MLPPVVEPSGAAAATTVSVLAVLVPARVEEAEGKEEGKEEDENVCRL